MTRERARETSDVIQRRAADSEGSPGKRTLVEQIQRKAAGGGGGDGIQDAAAHGVAGGGTALPHGAEIQRLFGPQHDVSGVQAHVGGAAAEASAAMGATAYATGNRVAFAESPSLHLAAHEAAHTVQQRAGVQLAGGVGAVGDRYEQHADAVADRVVRGESAADLLDGFGGGGGGGAHAVQHNKPPAKPAEPEVHLPAHVDNSVVPSWAKADVIKIQNELKRLGLYTLTSDGDLGGKTDAALVEAFGDNSWRTMTAADALTKLKAATPPKGDKGEHALRYGEMFSDGLLDVTLGVGFDEDGWNKTAQTGMEDALKARSFKVDNKLGIQLYNEAGRAVPSNAFGTFWVKPNALTYKPPAGAPRKIHAVVRLVSSPDGSKGAQAAGAFEDGMVQSDIAYYAGHGRYGSGPDFDRNFTVELLDDKKALTNVFDDYKELEKHLKTEGAPHGRSAWEQFQWRDKQGRVVVKGVNAGNLRMNKDLHQGSEFGAKLMYWQLDKSGTKPVTGKGGELDKQTKAHPEHKYRVVVFDGCHTNDYENSLRATPGMDKGSTDTFSSTATLYWNDYAKTLATFLDSVVAQQSAEDAAKAMDDVQTTTGKPGTGTIKAYGTDDNPVYK